MTSGFSSPQATWNSRYASDDYIFGTTPNAFLARQKTRLKPGMKALAVADGEGRNSVWLAEQGLAVTAFDIAPLGVDKARRLAGAHGVTIDYHVAAIEDWPWSPEAYDVVAAIFIQFLPPALRPPVFEAMMATLKPGGLLFLQGYTPRQLEYKTGGPPCAEHLYTADLLKTLFSGHELMELREHENELFEGTQHAGRSALIDCVVRKS